MKKTINRRTALEELIPDESKRKEMIGLLYQGAPILGEGGIFNDLVQSLVNAALEGEMHAHLQEPEQVLAGNRRNGYTSKTVRSKAGMLEIKTPRDRLGEHDPKLIKKWEREGCGSSLMYPYSPYLSIFFQNCPHLPSVQISPRSKSIC